MTFAQNNGANVDIEIIEEIHRTKTCTVQVTAACMGVVVKMVRRLGRAFQNARVPARERPNTGDAAAWIVACISKGIPFAGAISLGGAEARRREGTPVMVSDSGKRCLPARASCLFEEKCPIQPVSRMNFASGAVRAASG